MQQINLFVSELRPKKDWFSAKYLSALLVGVIFILMLVNYVKIHEISNLENTIEEKKLVLSALETELDKTKSAVRPNSRKEIESSIDQLQRKISSRERLAQLIKGQTLDENFSFNLAMTSMAKNAKSTVSLSRFTFSDGGRLIEMKGDGHRSFEVPQYLDLLRKEPVFNASQFGLITINNIKSSGRVEFSMGYDGSDSYSETYERGGGQ